MGSYFIFLSFFEKKKTQNFLGQNSFVFSHKLEVGTMASSILCITKNDDQRYVYTGHADAKVGKFFLPCLFFSLYSIFIIQIK